MSATAALIAVLELHDDSSSSSSSSSSSFQDNSDPNQHQHDRHDRHDIAHAHSASGATGGYGSFGQASGLLSVEECLSLLRRFLQHQSAVRSLVYSRLYRLCRQGSRRAQLELVLATTAAGNNNMDNNMDMERTMPPPSQNPNLLRQPQPSIKNPRGGLMALDLLHSHLTSLIRKWDSGLEGHGPGKSESKSKSKSKAKIKGSIYDAL